MGKGEMGSGARMMGYVMIYGAAVIFVVILILWVVLGVRG
jgi:hypothetical protein